MGETIRDLDDVVSDGIRALADEIVIRNERIQQLEKLAATLAAEVDAQRPVVKAARHWYNGGTDWSAKLATAVMTYETNRTNTHA